MRRFGALLISSVLFLAAMAAPVAATEPEEDGGGWIVVLEDGAGASSKADAIARAHGGRAGAVYETVVGGFSFEGTAFDALSLSRDPRVAAVVPESTFELVDSAGWGVFRIDANDAHQPENGNHRGAGVRIIVIDSGVDLDHPDLVPNLDLANGYNCIAPGTAPDDDNGHGTHVAGVAAAAYGPDEFGIAGVAADATIVPIKAFDASGYATTEQVLCAIDKAAEIAADGYPTVVNMSFADTGTDSVCDDGDPSDVVHEAICDLDDLGAIGVAASGNSGVDSATTIPAVFSEVITVSAIADFDGKPGALAGCKFDIEFLTECDDTLAGFSNDGAAVDVAAPGVQIYSTLPGGGHGPKSGTSMAAPHVAGTVALLLEGDPGLSSAETKKLLQDHGECPEPAGAINAGGATCTNQGAWPDDDDGATEPLVNALWAAQRADDTVRWVSPRPNQEVGGTEALVVRVLESAPGSATVTWQVDGGPSQPAVFESTSERYEATWDASTAAVGTHTMVVRSDDGAGTVVTDEITVIVPAPQTAQWEFNDESGDVAADATGNGWDGSLVGDPTWSNGIDHGGLRFDGGDDRVDLPSEVMDGLDDMTVTAWVRSNKPGYQGIVSGANAGNNNEYLWLFSSSTSIRIYTGTTSTTYLTWTVPSIADDEWHHIAAVRDGSGDEVTLFFDGSSLGSKAAVLEPLTVASGGLVLSQDQDSVGGGFDASQAFEGTLDGVHIYDRVLSEAEVAVLATPPVDDTAPTSPANLTALPTEVGIQLNWDAATDDETGVDSYRIYRDGTLHAEVTGTDLAHLDSAVSAATTYAYTVTAVNGAGLEGPASDPTSATTGSLDPTLEGWWPLDDLAGTLATDVSGRERHGTLVNGVSWTAGFRDGGAAFDGADDRIDLPAETLDGANNATVATWIRTTKTGQQGIVSGANSGNNNEYLWLFMSDTTLRVYTGASSTSALTWTVPSVADGNWHHLAVVRDATSGEVTVYFDGTSLGAKTASLSPLAVAGLVLGQEQDSVGGGFSSAQAFDGSMDDVVVWGRVLDPTEVAALAARPVDTTPPDAPSGLSANLAGQGIQLAWSAADDAESGIAAYRIYRRVGPSGAPSLLVEVIGAELGYLDEATEPETAYSYAVAAVNGAGLEGPASSEVTETTGPPVVTPTMDGWWALDDGVGTTALDSSGYGRHGTLVNGPSWLPQGYLGGALSFAGGDDRVELPHDAMDGAEDLTVAMWLRTTKTGQQAIVSAANGRNNNEYLWLFMSATSLRIYTGKSSSSKLTWSIPSIADGDWHHLAAVRDDANNTMTLYLDGVSQGPKSASLMALDVAPAGLVLAQDQDRVGGGYQSKQAFVGDMDEVRMYRRALTPAEVATLAGG